MEVLCIQCNKKNQYTTIENLINLRHLMGKSGNIFLCHDCDPFVDDYENEIDSDGPKKKKQRTK